MTLPPFLNADGVMLSVAAESQTRRHHNSWCSCFRIEHITPDLQNYRCLACQSGSHETLGERLEHNLAPCLGLLIPPSN